MADNIGYTPGTGATVAADEIGGVLHQRIKLGIGADGVAVDVSAANPMPITATSPIAVTGALTDAELRANPLLISASDPLLVSGPLTNAELRTDPLSVVDATNEARQQDMIFLLTRMLNYLNTPQGYDKSLQRQRSTAIIESGTVTTVGAVTTVGTVTNQTSMGGIQGQILVNADNLSAWALTVRSRIT